MLSLLSAAAGRGEKHPGSGHHFHSHPAREVQQSATKAPSHVDRMQEGKMLPHAPRRRPWANRSVKPSNIFTIVLKTETSIKETEEQDSEDAERQMGEPGGQEHHWQQPSK